MPKQPARCRCWTYKTVAYSTINPECKVHGYLLDWEPDEDEETER